LRCGGAAALTGNGPSLSEWVWAAVNVFFLIIAGILFFSFAYSVWGTPALAVTLIMGELIARLLSRWVAGCAEIE